jgi:hypothetical protein
MRASLIIAGIILISLSSCFTSQKLSLQSINSLDSIDVLDSKNQLPVEVKGSFHYYTMVDGSVNKIPNTHQVTNYYIFQDTLRIKLSPMRENPALKPIHYYIPVSKVESVTFRKFSFWKTSLIPVGLIGGSLGVLLIGLMNWHD